MVNYIYSYLLMDIIFLLLWLFLFIWRKDVRKIIPPQDGLEGKLIKLNNKTK